MKCVLSLSVNVIAKDEEPVIHRVMESLMSQLDGEYEVVVIEGYSEDGTYEVLRSFESPRFRIFRLKGNRGKARQYALERSSGKYVLALDADQVYTNLDAMLEDYYRKYSMYAITTGVSSMPILSPRHILLKVGGWRDLHYMEDFDLWARLAAECSFLYVPGWERIFGPHLRDHKSFRGNLLSRFLKRVELYRDSYTAGFPGKASTFRDQVPHLLGEFLAKTRRNVKPNYARNRALFHRLKVPPDLSHLEWELRLHYKLLLSQRERCGDRVFREVLEEFERVYGVKLW